MATCEHGNPAGSCFSCDYFTADELERTALRKLVVVAALVVGLVLVTIFAGAGCGGDPAMVPGAVPPALCVAAPGHVIIAHHCGECENASTGRQPFAMCATETAGGSDHQALEGCYLAASDEHCLADCAECGL